MKVGYQYRDENLGLRMKALGTNKRNVKRMLRGMLNRAGVEITLNILEQINKIKTEVQDAE